MARSPGPGGHYLPHKNTGTHGSDGRAQGERLVMRQPQGPVVQGNEMQFITMGELKDLSAGEEGD